MNTANNRSAPSHGCTLALVYDLYTMDMWLATVLLGIVTYVTVSAKTLHVSIFYIASYK